MSEIYIGLRPGVRLKMNGSLSAIHPWGIKDLGELSPLTISVLDKLQHSIHPESQMIGLNNELTKILVDFPFLFCRHLVAEQDVILSITPISMYYISSNTAIASLKYVRMSKFAYSRRAENDLITESPLTHQRVVIRDSSLAMLLSICARPIKVEEVERQFPRHLIPRVAPSILCLVEAGVMNVSSSIDGFDEDKNDDLTQWSFHDLLFHARSRFGRHDQKYGAAYAFINKIAPAPSTKPVQDASIELNRDFPHSVAASDIDFCKLLDLRESGRNYGDEPITLLQVSKFFYLTCRVKTKRPKSAGSLYETTSRLYPSGGACYDLEVYLVVNRCKDLDPGSYHYDPLGHRLSRIAADKGGERRLIQGAAMSMGSKGLPDIVIIITSRFSRVSWKYKSLSYALTLKSVGALYQTMYLAAAVLKLSCCALGGGDSDLFARTFGLEYTNEGSVGEFALGSRPSGSEPLKI